MNDDILLVDDDPAVIQALARILAGTGTLRFATSGEDALRLAREHTPDIMLLDAEMPGMSGFEVCRALKVDSALQHIPVIFVTAHSGAEFEISGFEAGAADFIAKPISAPLLVARVRTQLRLKALTDELRSLASIDGLTGLANRRAFDEALCREWRRSQRAGHAISLLMVDVDHFKRFNDHYGHPAGDACLRRVAETLRSAGRRPGDIAARYGGEEFALLLPETPRQGAERVATAVLDAIGSLAIPHAASQSAECVSLSIGIATCDVKSAGRAASSLAPPSVGARGTGAMNALVESADRALYQAKQGGRAQARWIDIGAGGEAAALVPRTA